MTAQDRAEMRQMLDDILSGSMEKMEGRYNVIHSNLIQIKEQTTKTNGRVTTLESEIRVLQSSEISRKAIFRFVGTLWAATVALIGVLIAVYETVIKN